MSGNNNSKQQYKCRDLYLCLFLLLEMEPGALRFLGKGSTAELLFHPLLFFAFKYWDRVSLNYLKLT